MKLTKYQHACLVLENDGRRLVIDPGNYSDDFVVPENVVAVVVTHRHADHADQEKLTKIFATHPSVLLIGPVDALADIDHEPKKIVGADQTLSVDSFNLHFYGGKHAEIYRSMPRDENVGVLVNDTFYYPGDSFSQPGDVAVETLALPVAGPWMKLSEAADFLLAVKPHYAFPTHDAISSRGGHDLIDKLMGNIAREINCDYRRIDGETIKLAEHRA